MFALGLAAHASLELAARAYFAQKDTVTPLLLAIGSAVLNVALGLLLMRSMGAAGLALANSVAVTLEVLALLWFLRPRLGGVEGRETAGQLLRVLGATLVMAGGVMGALLAGETLGLGGLALLAAAGAAGAVTYLAAAWALRVRELGRFVRAVIG
jgi:putative peptidoglycan lipid II flippase